MFKKGKHSFAGLIFFATSPTFKLAHRKYVNFCIYCITKKAGNFKLTVYHLHVHFIQDFASVNTASVEPVESEAVFTVRKWDEMKWGTEI
jgi:hypothetical protein